MSLQENVTDEEQSMLDILIDQDIQSESSGEGHCSQKRKAADDVYESNSEQRTRVCTYVMPMHLGVCCNLETLATEQDGSGSNTSDLYLEVSGFNLSWDSDYLILFMDFVSLSRQVPG